MKKEIEVIEDSEKLYMVFYSKDEEFLLGIEIDQSKEERE